MCHGTPSVLLTSAVYAALLVGCALLSARESAIAERSSHSLTLADLEHLAWQHNPALVAATERYEATRSRQADAGRNPDPAIAYDSSGIGSDGTAGAHGFYVEQEFVPAEKRFWTRTRAQHESDRRHWEVTAEELQVLAGVRRRYFEVLTLQRHLELDQHAIGMAEELQRLTRDMLPTDEATEADRLLIRGLVRRRHLDLGGRHSRLLAAWQELAASLGCPHLPPTRLEGTLEDSRLVTLDEQYFWATLIAGSASIQAAQRVVLAAGAALAHERAQAVPNVTVRAGVQYDFSADQPQGSLRVTVPLRVQHRHHGNLRAAEAELREAGAEVQRLSMELQQRGAQLLDRYRRNAAIVAEYRLNVLPDALRVYQIYTRRFADEKASYSDAESAQENYLSRLREYVDALGELRKAEAEIMSLLSSRH